RMARRDRWICQSDRQRFGAKVAVTEQCRGKIRFHCHQPATRFTPVASILDGGVNKAPECRARFMVRDRHSEHLYDLMPWTFANAVQRDAKSGLGRQCPLIAGLEAHSTDDSPSPHGKYGRLRMCELNG